jgi:hypothetical protein
MTANDRCAYEGCGHSRRDHVTRRVLGEPSRLLDQYGEREMEEITECVVCKRRHNPGTIATGWFTHSFQE